MKFSEAASCVFKRIAAADYYYYLDVRSNYLKISVGCRFLYFSGAGVEPSPLLLWPFVGMLYQTWMIDGDDCGAVSGMNEWQGKPTSSEKTFPSATLSTADLT
jgi:hypothetical protein